MAEENAAGCDRPAGGPVGEESGETSTKQATTEEMEVQTMIKVGQKAPDFTAPGYFKGDFTSVKLSDYLGKWILLCFYPGDFTFV